MKYKISQNGNSWINYITDITAIPHKMHRPLLVSTNLTICHLISCTRSCDVKCSKKIIFWDDRCQTAGELRTFSRSAEAGTRMGRWAGKQEQQMGLSCWLGPAATLWVSLWALSSPLSRQNKPIFILGLSFWWLTSEYELHTVKQTRVLSFTF